MRFPRVRGQNRSTSTGVLEAARKTVAGTRLKRSGMHRTLVGANAGIALRRSRLSTAPEQFPGPAFNRAYYWPSDGRSCAAAEAATAFLAFRYCT